MPGINWIPIKPATNGALYAAIVQIMMRDKTYNADVLSFPQQKAAEAAGYGAFTVSRIMAKPVRTFTPFTSPS